MVVVRETSMVDWTRKRRMVVSCGSQTGTAEEFTSRLAKEGARYFNTRQYNHKVLEDGEKPLLLSGNHSTARGQGNYSQYFVLSRVINAHAHEPHP